MAKFEIYKGFNKKQKTYIVTQVEADYDEVMKYCKKFFRCSESHVEFTVGYLYKGELYLEDPDEAKSRAVGVAYYV